MPNEELDEGEKQGAGGDLNPDLNRTVEEKGSGPSSLEERSSDKPAAPALLSIVVVVPPEDIPFPVDGVSKIAAGVVSDKDDTPAVTALKKICLLRSESFHEQCSGLNGEFEARVCQLQTEEDLVDLGCRCRGELSKAHRSCIDIWFRTRGSNKCEICQQVASNVPSPESQPNTNYWVWRIDPAFRGSSIGRRDQESACFSPLWVAFIILIGGLLLDVLISVSLGVSALPVNIIIGVLIVLGLVTALRLALECCHECRLRRSVQRSDTNVNIGYIPPV